MPLLQGNERQKIVVVGAGSHGTAMAYTAAVNQHDVLMFMRDKEQCQCINEKGYNPKHLSKFPLNPGGNKIRGIWRVEDLCEALAHPGAVLIMALPCQTTPDWIREHKNMIPSDVLTERVEPILTLIGSRLVAPW
jgi:glycerol-3-phosphate dehydrogenase